MKKRTGKLALALAALAMLVTTFGCKDPNNGIKTVEEETKSYTVTFNTNGGSAIEAVSVDEGNTLTLPDDPTKTGYDFKGWFTDDALSAEFDATVAITGDTTLYAKWAATSYTITYVLNDEKATNAAANPATYTIESEDITLADPTTENTEKPHFAGWYSDETCETAATGITKGSTGNKTFYAKWSDKLQYTVTFYNGETSLGKVKVTEGEKVTIPSTIAVEGYTIEGWYTDSALTKAFAADTIISADTALYAKKSVIKYTITYNLDGGTNAEANPANYNVESAAITLADPTKSGFTFAGWYKESAFTTKVTEIAKGSTGNVTLYAKWVANVVTHTVTFYDGTTVLSTASVEDGKTVTKPTDPTKDGYVFFGWYSDDAFETEFAFTSAIKADTKVYAKLIESLPSRFVLGEKYSGALKYTMGELSEWGYATNNEVYYNVDVSNVTLSENDTLEFSYTLEVNNGETINLFCIQSALDGYNWNESCTDGTCWAGSGWGNGSEIEAVETVASVTSFENNLLGFKFTIQSSSAAEKDLIVSVKDFSVKYKKYVAKTIETLDSSETDLGANYSYKLTKTALQSFYDADVDAKLLITVKNNESETKYYGGELTPFTDDSNYYGSLVADYKISLNGANVESGKTHTDSIKISKILEAMDSAGTENATFGIWNTVLLKLEVEYLPE